MFVIRERLYAHPVVSEGEGGGAIFGIFQQNFSPFGKWGTSRIKIPSFVKGNVDQSVYGLRYGVDNPGFDSWEWQEILLFLQKARRC